jgi:hypothetical protein
MATELPTIIMVEMSHQTGALIISSDFQTTELINWFKQATPVQIMYMQVPTFQASRCHGRGIMHSTKLIKAHVENNQFGKSAVISTQS